MEPPNAKSKTPDDDVTIVIDGPKLLLSFAVLVATLCLFFIIGSIEGRRDQAEEISSAPDTLKPQNKPSAEGFLQPECCIPPGFSTVSSLNEHAIDAKPSAEQMAQIHRLLPQGTRIHDLLRMDASLAFVLHQPRARLARATELTMFKFNREEVTSRNLGSFCLIPDFMLLPDGRAIGIWYENAGGGNSWDSLSLGTMLIEKTEVVYPEIEADWFQVALEIMLDEGVPVMVMLDKRFEFFEGGCDACGPIQRSIFELNLQNTWVDATLKHRPLVETWIREDIDDLREAKSSKDESMIVRAALNIYLDSETAGITRKYKGMVQSALREIGELHYIDLIDTASRRGCRIIEVVEGPPVSEDERRRLL
jgi:hypothetical protein